MEDLLEVKPGWYAVVDVYKALGIMTHDAVRSARRIVDDEHFGVQLDENRKAVYVVDQDGANAIKSYVENGRTSSPRPVKSVHPDWPFEVDVANELGICQATFTLWSKQIAQEMNVVGRCVDERNHSLHQKRVRINPEVIPGCIERANQTRAGSDQITKSDYVAPADLTTSRYYDQLCDLVDQRAKAVVERMFGQL